MNSLEQRAARVTREAVSIVPYDSRRPELFEEEKVLPLELIRRIADPEEHEPMKA